MKKIAVKNSDLVPQHWGIKVESWGDIVALGKSNLERARRSIRAEERDIRAQSSIITEIEKTLEHSEVPEGWKKKASCGPRLYCRECKHLCPCVPDALLGGEKGDLTTYCCSKLTPFWGKKKFVVDLDDKCHVAEANLVENIQISIRIDREQKKLAKKLKYNRVKNYLLEDAITAASAEMPLIPRARSKDDIPTMESCMVLERNPGWQVFDGHFNPKLANENHNHAKGAVPITVKAIAKTIWLQGPTDPRFLSYQEFMNLRNNLPLRKRWLKLIEPSGFEKDWAEALAHEDAEE